MCAAVCLLLNCGSKPTSASKQAEKDGVPVWVYGGRKDNTGLYAVGAGKLSNDITSRKMAVAQARLELAQSVEVSVKGITQTLVDDQGGGLKVTDSFLQHCRKMLPLLQKQF